LLLRGNECEGIADFSRPRGAADAMDVIVGCLRHIEVDYVAECLDVDAARRDVGRNENTILTVLESGQRRGALRLRAIPVNSLGLDAALHQLLGQTVSSVLGAREDQGLRHLAACEKS